MLFRASTLKFLPENVSVLCISDNGGCRSGFWYDNKTNIGPPVCRRKELVYLDWDDVASTVFIIVSFICILIDLLVLGIFVKNRKTPIVKAANRELSFLLLVLLLVAFLVPLTHIGEPTVPHCTAHIVIQGPLLTAILSIFLVKTHRVLIVFRARQPGVTSRQWFLGQRLQFVSVFVLVIVQIILVSIYVNVNRPTIDLYGQDDFTTKYTYVECRYGGAITFGFTYAYVISIAVFGFIFAMRSRHLPSNFRESRHIAASLATTLLVYAALLPAAPLTHGRVNAILTIISLTISPLGQLTFLFFPKCYVILFQPERNTVQELRRMTLAHMQRRSEHSLNPRNMPRLNTIDSDEDSLRATSNRQGTNSASNQASNTRAKHKDNPRAVYFIDDEYAAATEDSSNSDSREIVNITLHAKATFEGFSNCDICGVDNFAFVHDIPDCNTTDSVFSNRSCKQKVRPRSVSAEESSQVKKKFDESEHAGISKRRSDPTLNKLSTQSRTPPQELRVFSLTGTLSATITRTPPQNRHVGKPMQSHVVAVPSPKSVTKVIAVPSPKSKAKVLAVSSKCSPKLSTKVSGFSHEKTKQDLSKSERTDLELQDCSREEITSQETCCDVATISSTIDYENMTGNVIEENDNLDNEEIDNVEART